MMSIWQDWQDDLFNTRYGLVLASGPIKDYVLADLYAWLESHSGLSHPYVTTPTSTLGANTTSSSKK
jgi:hypothetical protein